LYHDVCVSWRVRVSRIRLMFVAQEVPHDDKVMA